MKKKTLAGGVALIAMGLSSPLIAGPIYVPIVDAQGANGKSLATQMWLSNFDGVERGYSSVFLKSETDGTELSGRGALNKVPANKAAYLQRAALEGETGLLEIDSELAINAWLQSSRGQRVFYTGVPVISDATRLPAGEVTYLNNLAREGKREVASLALVNVAREAASCQVDFLRADGTAIGAGVSVDVAALSMRPFADALGLASEPEAKSARVSCTQDFYAYALAVDGATSELAFATPETEFAVKAAGKVTTKAGAAIIFTQAGLFHTATTAVPKKIIRVPVPKQTGLDVITAEFDVVIGPWSTRQRSGVHNMLFFHRGRFRSNTIANINANGPNKNLFKTNQNLDLPAKANTKGQVGYSFQQGKTYHVRVVSDALNRKVVVTLSADGQVVKRMDFNGSVKNRSLVVPASGLVAEFGNYLNQELPEVGSVGWKFLNFRVEMAPQ